MEGVDIYDPVTNTIRSTEDQKVAAWFLDSDYDGRTFCMTQAFFPDKSAWEKLSKALGGLIDPDRFEALSGTVSLPFPAGKHSCVAVKVIDPRGNEVMQVTFSKRGDRQDAKSISSDEDANQRDVKHSRSAALKSSHLLAKTDADACSIAIANA